MAAFADLVDRGLLRDYDGALMAALRAEFAAKGDLPTRASLGLGSVEDKSSAQIRAEMTKADVVSALAGATVGDLPAR